MYWQIMLGRKMIHSVRLFTPEMIVLIAKAVGELPQQERQVLALYHYKELTMKNVGSVMGIGESRVSQLYTKGDAASARSDARAAANIRTAVPFRRCH